MSFASIGLITEEQNRALSGFLRLLFPVDVPLPTVLEDLHTATQEFLIRPREIKGEFNKCGFRQIQLGGDFLADFIGRELFHNGDAGRIACEGFCSKGINGINFHDNASNFL